MTKLEHGSRSALMGAFFAMSYMGGMLLSSSDDLWPPVVVGAVFGLIGAVVRVWATGRWSVARREVQPNAFQLPALLKSLVVDFAFVAAYYFGFRAAGVQVPVCSAVFLGIYLVVLDSGSHLLLRSYLNRAQPLTRDEEWLRTYALSKGKRVTS